jgi:pectate lyase
MPYTQKKKTLICRIRYGYAHVVNNLYQGWMQYAIGGSMTPSVKSQANLFIAPKSGNKEVITYFRYHLIFSLIKMHTFTTHTI